MNRNPNNTKTHKQCSGCKEIKLRKDFAKHNRNTDGNQEVCRACQKEYRLKNATKLKKKKREYAFKKKYGLTESDRQQMYIQQNGCCVICKQSIPYDKIVTDHNHTTNKVRKLLCQKCNWLVGCVETYSDLLSKVAGYLKEHE